MQPVQLPVEQEASESEQLGQEASEVSNVQTKAEGPSESASSDEGSYKCGL